MTERERLMQAVVDAVREYDTKHAGTWAKVRNALSALDAHPPEDAGETVELAVWRHVGGNVEFEMTGPDWIERQNSNWTRLGTTRLTLTKGGGA